MLKAIFKVQKANIWENTLMRRQISFTNSRKILENKKGIGTSLLL